MYKYKPIKYDDHKYDGPKYYDKFNVNNNSQNESIKNDESTNELKFELINGDNSINELKFELTNNDKGDISNDNRDISNDFDKNYSYIQTLIEYVYKYGGFPLSNKYSDYETEKYNLIQIKRDEKEIMDIIKIKIDEDNSDVNNKFTNLCNNYKNLGTNDEKLIDFTEACKEDDLISVLKYLDANISPQINVTNAIYTSFINNSIDIIKYLFTNNIYDMNNSYPPLLCMSDNYENLIDVQHGLLLNILSIPIKNKISLEINKIILYYYKNNNFSIKSIVTILQKNNNFNYLYLCNLLTTYTLTELEDFIKSESIDIYNNNKYCIITKLAFVIKPEEMQKYNTLIGNRSSEIVAYGMDVILFDEIININKDNMTLENIINLIKPYIKDIYKSSCYSSDKTCQLISLYKKYGVSIDNINNIMISTLNITPSAIYYRSIYLGDVSNINYNNIYITSNIPNNNLIQRVCPLVYKIKESQKINLVTYIQNNIFNYTYIELLKIYFLNMYDYKKRCMSKILTFDVEELLKNFESTTFDDNMINIIIEYL
jgi:hypothetical protein